MSVIEIPLEGITDDGTGHQSQLLLGTADSGGVRARRRGGEMQRENPGSAFARGEADRPGRE